MEIKAYMKEARQLTDQRLRELLPTEDTYPQIIHEAMAYSVFAGGKRFRPLLCLASCQTVCGSWEPALDGACALECIHTYSLIHDDLPGMDDDDYRRGKLTNHKVFGDGIAILAGDALLTYAFEILTGLKRSVKPEKLLQVIKEISQASGTAGMIGGQVVDIISEQEKPTAQLLQYIHHHKTGALLVASVRTGAILGGADEAQLEALTAYARQLGLAFQITDDILDVVGDEKKRGKPVGSDEKNEKATFPALFGLEQSRKMAQDAVKTAIAALEPLGEKGDILAELARYLLEREN